MFMEYYFQQKRDILAKILHILNIEEFKTPLTKAPEEYGSLTGCYDRLWVTSDVPSWVVVVGGDPGKTRFKKKKSRILKPRRLLGCGIGHTPLPEFNTSTLLWKQNAMLCVVHTWIHFDEFHRKCKGKRKLSSLLRQR